jgi:L-lactate dehydrogenase complex protein LldG
MGSAREHILASIRNRATRQAGDAINQAWQSPVPDPAVSLQRFTTAARKAAATVAHVASTVAIPEAVHQYLRDHELPPRIVCGDDLPDIPWQTCAVLECSAGPIPSDGAVLVSGCLAAVAEVGAVALVGAGATHAAAPFLAATHIVVVDAGQLLGSLEALWAMLRGKYGAARWPRSLCLMLGPSRTADLGIPSRLGAHGPLRVHIIVIDAAEPAGVA